MKNKQKLLTVIFAVCLVLAVVNYIITKTFLFLVHIFLFALVAMWALYLRNKNKKR